MSRLPNFRRMFVVIGLLGALAIGQMVAAQSSDQPEIPQWARDRMQYETSFVYSAPAAATQVVVDVSNLPQWVRDRMQYETSYVPIMGDFPPAQFADDVPQWARDRQQYETGYVYVPQGQDVGPTQVVLAR